MAGLHPGFCEAGREYSTAIAGIASFAFASEGPPVDRLKKRVGFRDHYDLHQAETSQKRRTVYRPRLGVLHSLRRKKPGNENTFSQAFAEKLNLGSMFALWISPTAQGESG